MTRCTLYRQLICILFWIFAKIVIRHEMVFVKMAGIQISSNVTAADLEKKRSLDFKTMSRLLHSFLISVQIVPQNKSGKKLIHKDQATYDICNQLSGSGSVHPWVHRFDSLHQPDWFHYTCSFLKCCLILKSNWVNLSGQPDRFFPVFCEPFPYNFNRFLRNPVVRAFTNM